MDWNNSQTLPQSYYFIFFARFEIDGICLSHKHGNKSVIYIYKALCLYSVCVSVTFYKFGSFRYYGCSKGSKYFWGKQNRSEIREQRKNRQRPKIIGRELICLTFLSCNFRVICTNWSKLYNSYNRLLVPIIWKFLEEG